MTDQPSSTALVDRPEPRGLMASAIDMTIDAGKASLVPTNLGEVVAFANLMARAGPAVPAHLREQPGACLAVTMQAFHHGMEPFMAANKSYFVNDRLAWEAQYIAAVVLKNVPHVGYPKYSYAGEGAKRRCTVVITTPDGEEVPLESPEIGRISPKNSPLWKTDEDQQLGYYTIRAWARRHRPDVLLGVYDREEAASMVRDDTATSFAALEARAEGAAPAVDAPPRTGRKAKNTPGEASGAESANDKSSQSGAPQGNQTTPAQVAGEPAGREAAHASEGAGSELKDPAPDAKDPAPPQEETAPAAETAAAEPAAAGAETGTRTGITDLKMGAGKVELQKPEVAMAGVPLGGESYVIANEAPNEQGGRNLYKDGQVAKSIHPTAARAYSAYAGHAPAAEAAQGGAEGERSPGSDASLATGQDEANTDGFADFAEQISVARDWAEIDHATTELMRSDAWKANPTMRNPARKVAYHRVNELGIKIDLRENLRAWRAYIEWESDPQALSEGIQSVHSMGNPAWAALAPEARTALDNAAFDRKHALQPPAPAADPDGAEAFK